MQETLPFSTAESRHFRTVQTDWPSSGYFHSMKVKSQKNVPHSS